MQPRAPDRLTPELKDNRRLLLARPTFRDSADLWMPLAKDIVMRRSGMMASGPRGLVSKEARTESESFRGELLGEDLVSSALFLEESRTEKSQTYNKCKF